jgi:hypothetical protein
VNARITPATLARLHAELDARFTTTTNQETPVPTAKPKLINHGQGVYTVSVDTHIVGEVRRTSRLLLTMDARMVERDVRWQGFTPDGRRTYNCSKRSRVVADLVAGYFVKEA